MILAGFLNVQSYLKLLMYDGVILPSYLLLLGKIQCFLVELSFIYFCIKIDALVCACSLRVAIREDVVIFDLSTFI
jgi:hypothetical protein